MGLDIHALSNIKVVHLQKDIKEDLRDEQDYRDGYSELYYVYPNSFFQSQADGLEAGYYSADGDFHFRAGSYSGYGEWRKWLCKFALNCEPEEVWATGVTEGAFVELIHFSDCEGVIGPKTAAKLYEDFCKWEDSIRKYKIGSELVDEYNLERYLEWKKAFELAKDTGAVIFG